MDKIGMFKGKPISEMTREELLEFASWVGKEVEELREKAWKYDELCK